MLFPEPATALAPSPVPPPHHRTHGDLKTLSHRAPHGPNRARCSATLGRLVTRSCARAHDRSGAARNDVDVTRRKRRTSR
jgi:hypothetical protein